MIELEVRFPQGGRASSSFSNKKPMAEVSCILDSGKSREIVVPVRVGRLLQNDAISLPLPEDEAFDAIHALEERCCFSLLTEMLSRRDYASQEAADKLSLYGYRIEEIQSVISRAQHARFLNDNRFARYFIDERKRRGWGRRKIELELKRRGIVVEDMPGYPEEFFDADDDVQRALEVIERVSIPTVKPYEKLIHKLLNKGFSYSVAKEAVRMRLSDTDDVTF